MISTECKSPSAGSNAKARSKNCCKKPGNAGRGKYTYVETTGMDRVLKRRAHFGQFNLLGIERAQNAERRAANPLLDRVGAARVGKELHAL